FPHESEVDVLINESQQVILGNLIFQTEVVEQPLTPAVVSHHDQQASNHRNPAKHASFEHAFAKFQLLIAVTFSTPTPDNNICLLPLELKTFVCRGQRGHPPKTLTIQVLLLRSRKRLVDYRPTWTRILRNRR